MIKDMKQILESRFNSKQKKGLIHINQLKQTLLIYIKSIDQEDFIYLYEDLTEPYQNQQIDFHLFLELYYTFEHQSKKVFNRIQSPLSLFLFNSLISVQNHKLICQVIQTPQDKLIDIDKDFKDILSEDYLKKLINMGANGLMHEKKQQKIQKYFYYYWIENNVDLLAMDTQKPQVQLLKAVWNFDFSKALRISQQMFQNPGSFNNYKNRYQNQEKIYEQISILIPGLQNLEQVEQIVRAYPIINQCICNRDHFNIQLKQELFKKKQFIQEVKHIQSTLQAFDQIMQLLSFTCQYYQMVEESIVNPYFKETCRFLANCQNKKQKTQIEIQNYSNMEDISIVERFLYAKKFFTPENFQTFKTLIRQKINEQDNIDYILLFGNKKQSEVILQNYLDNSNQIEKVALISVYLKTFSEQNKIGIRQQKTLYTKFIKVYEWLLDKKDGGISRHLFDKKCLSIQVQKKRKNLTKTFSFDCSNCKAQQVYSALSKKIKIDSNQPKLKGYHYFAKDSRSQIMHCIECMQLLPRCSICLYPIAVYNAYAEEMKKNVSQKKIKNRGEQIEMALVWCPKCKHGGHFNHIMDWFQQGFQQEQRKCPVANCKCKCSI